MKKLFLFVTITVGIISCLPKVNSQTQLKPIESFSISIKEPSGITVFDNHLYIVSDQNGVIYKTSLNGRILKKIKTVYSDLEGITANPLTKSFFIVNESKRSLIELDSKGKFIQKTKIKGKQKNKNSGLEGVCFDSNKNRIYIINEKSPSQLLELNLKGKLKNTYNLNFSKDISGIYFDSLTNSLWLISDESQTIFNISKKGKLLKSYNIDVEKGEGIAIYNDQIYVVSDSLNKLFIFEFPN